jgi:queuine tRNA-ribosyltransferase
VLLASPALALALRAGRRLMASSSAAAAAASASMSSSSSSSSSAAAAAAAPAAAAAASLHVCGPALTFSLDATCGRARATTLSLPHGPVRTPVFMPVGTHGTVKGLSALELAAPPLDCDIVLANTYHLGSAPGGALLARHGGLHRFMAWPRALLTDSGGFQMVSLLHLAEITEEGVTFAHPVDGRRMLLTPEASMRLQNEIGADVMMALDDVVSSKTVDVARFAEACHRTLRWIDRCIAAHARPREQNLFGIVQGGLDVSPGGLRDVCLEGMLQRDASLPGYAIGGLAGGEEKDAFWRVVDHCCRRLPAHKPRYLMGVGYPLDLVVCSALGVDMYDCVYPTRTARFGTALAGVPGGLVKVKLGAMAADARPLDPRCACFVCAGYSRAQLHVLMKTEALGPQLLTHHNLAYMARLTREMRAAVVAGEYPAFVRDFLAQMFPPEAGAAAGPVPRWAVDALAAAGIDVATSLSAAAPAAAGAAGGGAEGEEGEGEEEEEARERLAKAQRIEAAPR